MQIIQWQSTPGIQQRKRTNKTPQTPKSYKERIKRSTNMTPRDRTPKAYEETIKRLEKEIAAKEQKILNLQKEPWVDPEDPFHCLRCDHRLSRRKYINSHMCWPGHPSTSVTVHPTHCEQCNKTFADRNSLGRHKKKCKGANGKDSTAKREAQDKATVRKGADGLHPRSEVCSSMSSHSTMSEKCKDMGSAYDAPSSSSDIDFARGIDKVGPGRQGTVNAISFTSGHDSGSFSNDSTLPFHQGVLPGSGGTSTTASAAPPVGQCQDLNGTSYPVNFPLGYVETGDQGKAFFQNPFSTHKFGNEYGGQNAIYNAPPIDQSQIFLKDPFGTPCAGDGNVAFLPSYRSIMTDEGQAFSQNPYMTSHHPHDMAFADPRVEISQILQRAGR